METNLASLISPKSMWYVCKKVNKSIVRLLDYVHNIGTVASNCMSQTSNLLLLLFEILLDCPDCCSSCIQAPPLSMWLTAVKDSATPYLTTSLITYGRDVDLNVGFPAETFLPLAYLPAFGGNVCSPFPLPLEVICLTCSCSSDGCNVGAANWK